MSNLVKSLYKYYSPQRWDNFAKDWTIRFTPPSELNDPFEFSPHVSSLSEKTPEAKSIRERIGIILEKVILHFKTSWEFLVKTGIKGLPMCIVMLLFGPLIIKYISKSFFDSNSTKRFLSALVNVTLSRKKGVLCLTTNMQNLLMWAHYADSHRGFVVEISTEDDIFCIEQGTEGKHFNQIKYTSARCSKAFDALTVDDIYFNKGDIWAYEDEWRVVVSLDDKNIPWKDSEKGIAYISPSNIVSIIFGASMPMEDIKNYCRQIRTQAECKNIKLKRALTHLSRYELVIEDITEDFYKEDDKK